ncbi:hypothetical protein [Burkholderia sp. Bp8963]|uniref:hypothetical protein n=1 Tax=Burkholderia sp. Bp8963 TaxID=2184547 RepID=UPI001639595D|nr:hypothetical protein [Burkholderia sp. Bp8963]
MRLFMRWLVAKHQLRLIRFLLDCCELDASLWDHALDQAQAIVSNAARGKLRTLSCYRD